MLKHFGMITRPLAPALRSPTSHVTHHISHALRSPIPIRHVTRHTPLGRPGIPHHVTTRPGGAPSPSHDKSDALQSPHLPVIWQYTCPPGASSPSSRYASDTLHPCPSHVTHQTRCRTPGPVSPFELPISENNLRSARNATAV